MTSTKNFNSNFTEPVSQIATTETSLQSFIVPNAGQQIIVGFETVSKNHTLGATLRKPVGTAPKTLHLLTHGIGFDLYYWDFTSGYSYSDFAAKNWLAIFFYSRLGVGSSAKPDPIEVIQAPLEV